MIRLAIALALVAACATDGASPPGDPAAIAYPACGPAPLDITWTITVDDNHTPDPSDDHVVLEPAEYAKVGDFHERALDWMGCTIDEYRSEHGGAP